MQTQTRTLVGYGHREFLIEYDEPADADALSFMLKHIVGEVASGRRFQPGDTLQVGWTPFRVESGPGDFLSLHEPSFGEFTVPSSLVVPPRFLYLPAATKALEHLAAQLAAAKALHVEGPLVFPSPSQTGLVCPRFFKADRCVEMYRSSAGRPTDSGWFIGCDSTEHDHNDPATGLGHVSLHAIACKRPEIVAYLSFPIDSAIVFTASGPKFEITPE